MFMFVQVLIVGGGDGGVARECAKHPKVENITMIEIDQVLCLHYIHRIVYFVVLQLQFVLIVKLF